MSGMVKRPANRQVAGNYSFKQPKKDKFSATPGTKFNWHDNSKKK